MVVMMGVERAYYSVALMAAKLVVHLVDVMASALAMQTAVLKDCTMADWKAVSVLRTVG